MADMGHSPGFRQLHLALPLRQLGFFFRGSSVVTVGAAHASNEHG